MMSEAEQEVLSYIQGNTRIDLRTTMKGLVEWFEKKPYGWYLAAIQCITAKLCAREKIEIRQDSNVLEGPALEKALRNTHGFGNSIIDPQLDFTASQVRNLKDFYEHFFDTPAKANEAKPLARETQEAFKNTLVKLEGLLSQKGQYPFLAVLVEPIRKLQDLSKKSMVSISPSWQNCTMTSKQPKKRSSILFSHSCLVRAGQSLMTANGFSNNSTPTFLR